MAESYLGEYGSYLLASQYCGFSRCPRQWPGVWQHGWLPRHFNVHCESVIGTNGLNFQNREIGKFYVARTDQVDFLSSVGFHHVEAVGLPLVYCEVPAISRVPGSLLVVPVHSLSQSEHDWDFDKYADEILKIRDRFSSVTVCVHGSCVDKGYWTKAFELRGMSWVRGACHSDMGSIPRVAELFSRSEFVTSNGFGSHLSYASALGCKVSLWGTMARWDAQCFKADTYAVNAPEAFAETMRFVSEPFLRQQYSDFFTDPWDAPLRVEWGREEIGWENRKSPDELKRIFGWDLKTRVIRGVRGRLRKAFGLGHR